MKKHLLSIIPLFCLIIVVSCTKSTSSNNSCTLSSTSLVGNYKVTDAYLVSYPPIPGISGDIFTSPLLSSYSATLYPTCERDDIISLNAGGVYIYTDAGVVCSPNDSTSGIWTLKSDTLIISAKGKNDTAEISNFNCTTGSTSILNYNNFQGTGAQVKITFTRQ